MKTTTSALTGELIDTSSEQHRHECECRWLLANMPSRTDKHLWLFGVNNRQSIINRSGELRDDWKTIAAQRSITHIRGLKAADRILNDARKIYDRTKAGIRGSPTE